MTIADLEVLYEYGYWANQKLFDVLSMLTAEEFTQTVAGSYGSIRNTMVHILSAEAGWLDRGGGPARGPRLKPDDFPTVKSVVHAWHKVETQVREFLSALKDEDLTRIVEYEVVQGNKRSLPLGEMMEHAAIHGVHHRGQVALLLRLIGHVPGDFDFLLYCGEKRGAPAW
jgi:uncharacterized damage-inducible protein DinB